MNTKMGPARGEGETARSSTPTAPMATVSGPTDDVHGSASQRAASKPPGGMRIRLFGRTDVGRIREHNEDNFLVADLTQRTRGLMDNIRNHGVGPQGTLFAVCDGMGGAAAGEVASKLAVDIIYEQMQAGGPPKNRDELARRLVRAVEVAGLRIFAEAKLDRNRRGMGTTATAAALIDDHLFLAQVGDSRGYVLRGDRFELVTRDQSLVNQLIEAGQLTEEEAENFEHSNIILQALGTADTVQVDLTVVRLRHGDTLLLCSDGLSGMVRGEEMRQVLLAHQDPLDVCKVLTDKANEAGGHDNITVIVAKFEGGPMPVPADEPLRYQKYSFQDDGNATGGHNINADTARFTPPILTPPVAVPEVARAVAVPPPGAGAGRLGATQIGLNSDELMREIEKAGERRERSTPPTHSIPAGDGELRVAGVPAPAGVSMWIWITTTLALALVAFGVYALLGGRLP